MKTEGPLPSKMGHRGRSVSKGYSLRAIRLMDDIFRWGDCFDCYCCSMHIAIAFAPTSSSQTCTFRIRGTNLNKFSDNRYFSQVEHICEHQHSRYMNRARMHPSSNRNDQHHLQILQWSLAHAQKSPHIYQLWTGSCSRLYLSCNGTTWPLARTRPRASSRSSPSANSDPTWRSSSSSRRWYDRRRSSCWRRLATNQADKLCTRSNLYPNRSKDHEHIEGNCRSVCCTSPNQLAWRVDLKRHIKSCAT